MLPRIARNHMIFKMADEVLFEFLHIELVSQVLTSAKKDEKVNIVYAFEQILRRFYRHLPHKSSNSP